MLPRNTIGLDIHQLRFTIIKLNEWYEVHQQYEVHQNNVLQLKM